MAQFKIREEQAVQDLVYTDERLWLDADGNVVKDGDASAVSLLASEGSEIPRGDAVRLGLVKPTKAEQQAAESADAADETADAVEGQTVDEVLDAVGDDPGRAQAALDAENASAKPRKTLVAKLEQIAGGAEG